MMWRQFQHSNDSPRQTTVDAGTISGLSELRIIMRRRQLRMRKGQDASLGGGGNDVVPTDPAYVNGSQRPATEAPVPSLALMSCVSPVMGRRQLRLRLGWVHAWAGKSTMQWRQLLQVSMAPCARRRMSLVPFLT